MAVGLDNANQIVRSIIRTIDKRAEYDAKNLAQGERPAVTGTLSVRRRSTTVVIPVEALEAAAKSAVRRHELRTTLKRALDRMQFEATPTSSTRMSRPSTAPEGFFRPPPAGRRAGRR